MLRIGLTGGIGSGKSTVAGMFAAYGVPVIDADEIARSLVERDQPAYQKIMHAFGASIADSKGEIDREHLRTRIFDNPDERLRLEAIIHPLVRHDITMRLQALEAPYCVVVIPLLIEAKLEDLVDRILVVDCDEAQQIKRVGARSGLNKDQIRRIMEAQVSPAERRRHADDVIVNDATLDQLEAGVGRLHDHYRTLSGTTPASPSVR